MKTKPTLGGEIMEATSIPNTMLSDFIQNLVDNYRNNQLKTINTASGANDAHSIWFDLATLKKFVSDIETEAQKVNAAISENDLGIRFYYAAYPKQDDWSMMENTPIGKECAGMHTLVMIPTLKMADEQGAMLNYDFNPLDSSSFSRNGNAGELKTAMALSARDNSTSLSGETLAQNHGALVPPESTKTEQY
jgi:hypothetical protein